MKSILLFTVFISILSYWNTQFRILGYGVVNGEGKINISRLFISGNTCEPYPVIASISDKSSTTNSKVVPCRTYSTNFPLNESPISEGGNWINGSTTGLDWGYVSTTAGQTHTHPGTASYADATASLTGTWDSMNKPTTVVMGFPAIQHLIIGGIFKKKSACLIIHYFKIIGFLIVFK